MADKITKRDYYNILKNIVDQSVSDQDMKDNLHTFIDHEVELIIQRAEKSKQYQKEHQASNDAMTDMILDVLNEATDPMTVSDIVAKIVDSTPQKIVYRLGQLFKSGKINKDTQTVKVDGSSARKVTFYTIV